MKAKLVLHHDDPPCEVRLENGRCPECKLVPDMQSTAFHYYCPKCLIPLIHMACVVCRQTFEKAG